MRPRSSFFAASTLSIVTILTLCQACGGSVAAGPDPADGESDADAIGDAFDTGSIHHRDTGAGETVTWDTHVEPDTYLDPGCPDAPLPPPENKCDPFESPSRTCPKGEACMPFVTYPTVACEPEVYGTTCYPAGTGTQGSPCSGGGCAGGFVCVVSGAGNQCGAICKAGAVGACAEGLVCSPIDVPGFGVCL